MEYRLYKLRFRSAVHFGKHNLDEGEYACCADTIFSALCQEALKIGDLVLRRLYDAAKEGNLLLSDAFPYMGDTYFLPKPIRRIALQGGSGDQTAKKAFKKLKYIPVDMLDVYLRGEYDVETAPDFKQFGHFEMKTAASIRGEEETKPYRVGTYYYHAGNGLYLIIGYQKEEILEMAEDLLERLSYSGLGGERAAGLGRFELVLGKMPEKLRGRLEGSGSGYMSLSVSLPTDEELDRAMDGAEYLLNKRSGFVLSEHYAEQQMRKRDLYAFQSGSCFTARFGGDVYDVSSGGRHPVYRYAKPMLMEI